MDLVTMLNAQADKTPEAIREYCKELVPQLAQLAPEAAQQLEDHLYNCIFEQNDAELYMQLVAFQTPRDVVGNMQAGVGAFEAIKNKSFKATSDGRALVKWFIKSVGTVAITAVV